MSVISPARAMITPQMQVITCPAYRNPRQDGAVHRCHLCDEAFFGGKRLQSLSDEEDSEDQKE